MRRGHEDHRRPASRRGMASGQDVAVLVRHFMSPAMTIPPTITLRAHSLAPTIGRDRNDLLPHCVTALITSQSGAVPARASLSSPSTARRTGQVRLATCKSETTTTCSPPHQSPQRRSASPRLRSTSPGPLRASPKIMPRTSQKPDSSSRIRSSKLRNMTRSTKRPRVPMARISKWSKRKAIDLAGLNATCGTM